VNTGNKLPDSSMGMHQYPAFFSQLQKLSLHVWGGTGIVYLCDALPSVWRSLRYLDLGATNAGPDFVVGLIQDIGFHAIR
jgi:hypothetical protein